MKKIFLVSCAKSKKTEASKGEELYVSTLFQEAKKFALNGGDIWFILSAKYGLLNPQTVVDPYEKTLKKMTSEEKKTWAMSVSKSLKPILKKDDQIIFLAGKDYRKDLEDEFRKEGIRVTAPLRSMGLGKQMGWLIKVNRSQERMKDLDYFYNLLEELIAGKIFHLMKNCDGKLDWPKRGVYFFFSPEETRALYPEVSRVVRVGTHSVSKGSKTTLWDRLKTHKGSEDGSGNHRASVFRLHVGQALINKEKLNKKYPNWGAGETANNKIRISERNLEEKVSAEIGRMSLTYLRIEDEPGSSSDRAYIERNAIALLSGPDGPIDVQTSKWLGNNSAKNAIKESGLWNVRHVDEFYDKGFLGVMKEYVNGTLGKTSVPKTSIAPKGWENRIIRGTEINQLAFFSMGDLNESKRH